MAHKAFTVRKTWVHERPSKRSPKIDRIAGHRVIYVACKVRKQWGPHDTWYKRAKAPGWVNAKNVIVFGRVPHCHWTGPARDQDQNQEQAPVENASLLPAQHESAPGEVRRGEAAGHPLG